eukprot:g5422.t1
MISNPRNRSLLDLRHRLQAAVWREMRMKLTDYETSHLLKHHPNLLDDENPQQEHQDEQMRLQAMEMDKVQERDKECLILLQTTRV